MLRRDVLLVGRVNSKGMWLWSRVSKSAALEKLNESRSDLFHVYRTKIYLLPDAESNALIVSSLYDSVLDIVGHACHPEVMDMGYDAGTMKKYIKNNAVCVGQIDQGFVTWIEDTWALGFEKKTLLQEWSRDVQHFEVIDNKVYYIKPKQEIVEALYYECIEIAGSELRLAKALARDLDKQCTKQDYRREMLRTLATLERFSFKQREHFSHYVGVFVKYLRDHEMPTDGLFSPELSEGRA